jgi:outer membrane usher protein
VELQSTSQQVAPLSGAVVMLKYPTVTGMPVLIKSQMSDGEPLPFGARVQDMQGNNVGTVSQGGRIYARIARSNENLTVQWGDGDARMCKINVALPEQPGKAGVGAAFARLQAPCVVDTKARYLGKSPRLLKPADVSTRPGAPRASIAAPATPAS